MIKNLLLIPIKSLLLAAFLLMLVNLVYFGFAYFDAGFTGAVNFDIEKFVLTLDGKPHGLAWGATKTYGFAGFLFIIVLVREWLKAGMID